MPLDFFLTNNVIAINNAKDATGIAYIYAGVPAFVCGFSTLSLFELLDSLWPVVVPSDPLSLPEAEFLSSLPGALAPATSVGPLNLYVML